MNKVQIHTGKIEVNFLGTKVEVPEGFRYLSIEPVTPECFYLVAWTHIPQVNPASPMRVSNELGVCYFVCLASLDDPTEVTNLPIVDILSGEPVEASLETV